MKSSYYIALLSLLQFINLTSALPWDLPTCPLPAPPPRPAQRVLPPDIDADGNTRKKTNPIVIKIISLLLPRQTTCQRLSCDSQYYCCGDQTCSLQSGKWVCIFPTRTLTITSTWRSTTTSIVTTTQTVSSITSDTRTIWIYISTTGVWTTTLSVTRTSTATVSTTTSVTLTKRGMTTPTPAPCVRRPEEEEKMSRALAKRADPTVYVTRTVVVTSTPAYTYFFTTTWLYTYWITGQTTTTRTSVVSVDSTSTITSTYVTTATTTATITGTETTATAPPSDTSSRVPSSVTPDSANKPDPQKNGDDNKDKKKKIGAGVGGGVAGLVLIVLIALLIWKMWKKFTKPTAEEEWAGNQPVEDNRMGPGTTIFGAGGVRMAPGETDKSYQDPYKAGYYDQDGNPAMTETSSPTPPPPPAAYFQPAQYPHYPELDPNTIHAIPRRPISGSPAPPSYQG